MFPDYTPSALTKECLTIQEHIQKKTDMQVIFEMQDGRSISLQAGLPTGYRGIILQGAVSASVHTASEMIPSRNFRRL